MKKSREHVVRKDTSTSLLNITNHPTSSHPKFHSATTMLSIFVSAKTEVTAKGKTPDNESQALRKFMTTDSLRTQWLQQESRNVLISANDARDETDRRSSQNTSTSPKFSSEVHDQSSAMAALPFLAMVVIVVLCAGFMHFKVWEVTRVTCIKTNIVHFSQQIHKLTVKLFTLSVRAKKGKYSTVVVKCLTETEQDFNNLREPHYQIAET